MTAAQEKFELGPIQKEWIRRLLKETEITKCYMAMNDDHFTWPEIADYIEANPENVFTKSV